MKPEAVRFTMGKKMRESLITNHGNLFENLYIYVTNSCNKHCAHCYLGDRLIEKQEMPLADVIAHLKFWRELGSSKICFLGGEPTLYPYLRECVDYAWKLDYKKVLINSNLSKSAYNTLEEFSLQDFSYIQTSLDGADEKTHDRIRGQGSFVETVDSVRKLINKGHDIRIIMTVNKYNISEMIPMVEFAEYLGASLIKFHIMSEIGNAAPNDQLGLTPEAWNSACTQLMRYASSRSNRSIKISFQPAYMDFNSQKEIFNWGYRGCLGKFKERLSVFPDGKCYICSFLFDFDSSYAELTNGVIELNASSVERCFVSTECTSCTKCQFDGCIAEDYIYGCKTCSEHSLFPVCRLWKIQI